MKTRRGQRQGSSALAAAAAAEASDEEESVAQDVFTFDGKSYPTYQAMVDAKRARNRDVLLKSGLLEAKAAVDHSRLEERREKAAARGLKRSKAPRAEPGPRRKSSRLAGGKADPIYVEDERGGKIEIRGMTLEGGSFTVEPEKPEFYNGRVNDGSDISISAAVELGGAKWVKEGTVAAAEHFVKETLTEVIDEMPLVSGKKRGSPTSVARGGSPAKITSSHLQSKLGSLSLDEENTKVCPDRIYSVVTHPSLDKLIACAGDKKGYLGIWNVDNAAGESATDGVHLFKPHSGAISSLAWNAAGTSLLSSSYDGTVRLFDANKGVFEEIFASYSDDKQYKGKIGYGTDHGWNSWIQSMELDHRYESGKCFFLSTSEGGVMHIDLRTKGVVTFDQELSEKKINTVSLHCDGNIMATGGLSGLVQLWDVRKVAKLSNNSSKLPKPLAWQSSGRSINSAYFSPSGKRIITTTQSNRLEILEDAHVASGLIKVPSAKSIKHDNQTGRWLSTFMAKWHPGFADKEIFVVGSMKKPRTIEVWGDDGKLLRELQGDALSAVASRCCFHPNASEIIVVGGNSSGRVTVSR
ncbi:hypothetical protein ACHAXT_001783 [Thalassiosira profunda]